MRRKLFIFFMLILFLGVAITGVVSYNFTKNWIVQNTEDTLRAEALLIEDYVRKIDGNINYDDFAKHIKSKIGKRVTIIRGDGKVIGESDFPSEKLNNHINRTEFRLALNNGEGTSIRFSDTEQTTMYYYAKKAMVGNSVYVIRLSIQLHDIKIIQESYLKLVVFTITIGIIFSSILVYLYVNKITDPIRKLTRMANTISLGNYEKRINISSNDEIGQLGNSFNLMAERLQQAIVNLADKKNKLISILTSSDDGIIVVDKDKRILLINPAAKKIFGIEEDIIGKHFIEAIRNYDIENIIKNIPQEEIEITINYPTTRHLRIKASNAINYDKDNEVMGVLIVIHDITKIKQLEKMRTDFVANVSHELKTPLTSIKGFAETLKFVEDKPTRDKFLDIIYIESERLTRLINDILTLSELEHKGVLLNIEKVNVNKCIEEVYYIMRSIAENKNINLSFNYNCEDVIINGNIDKFKQMMINLVDNAIKYTNSGGKVSINLNCKDDKLIIEVKDTGIGIPEEHIPRLFERFYRVDKGRSRNSGGTGLGLAIVKHIVKMFKGNIEVMSKIGEGTVFTIYLPVINYKLTQN
jgi:two-component system phosphate regulon sensor histidine kinase PhoR